MNSDNKNTLKSSSPKTIEELYQKKTDREHVLIRPDTYIGDIIKQSENLWILEENNIIKKTMTYVPGLYKIFDEILVNAWDRTITDNTCDTMKVNINQEEGLIEIMNNGEGIPIVIHKEYNIYVPELIFGELRSSTNYDDNERRITGGRNGLGAKCLHYKTNIPLWEGGYKYAAEINIGDKLIGDDGNMRTVLGIIMGKGKMYKINQEYGESYIVNEDHILTIYMKEFGIIDKSIKDLLNMDNDKIKLLDIRGIRGNSINRNKIQVVLDPYILGIWLGKGFERECDYKNDYDSLYNYENIKVIKKELLEYNLINNEHIPKEYLLNDKETRLKLLAGLLDSCGKIIDNYIEIDKINFKLVFDIVYMVRSLGFYCKLHENTNKTYIITIFGNINDIPSILMLKKYELSKVYNTTGILSIEQVDDDYYVGIKIDDNERFLINDFTVTHNCTNIFSTEFTVETVDAVTNKKFIQTYSNNMGNRTKPKITNLKGDNIKSYTKILFKPDLIRFGLDNLSDDFISLFKKRVYDIAGCTRKKLKVFFNNEKIELNGFKKYIELYYPETDFIFEENERWQIGIIYIPDNTFEQISYVNGICTYYGGTHVNYIVDNVVKKLIEIVEKKFKGIKVKSNQIKDNLVIFVNSIIENPAFTSQTKEQLKTKISDFGSLFELSEKAIKKLAASGIIEQVGNLAKFKELEVLKKTDGKKVQSVRGIPKLEDAEDAGTKNSYQCKLILTEGDSAKALAMSARKVIGNKLFGVFPLKGKLLNVRDATPKQLTENEEIVNLIKILGLKYKTEYSDVKQLRYGGIILMTDADVDGSHIKGLLINFIHYFWPSLLKTNKFITCLSTPIVKVTKGKESLSFYNLTQYEQWKENNHNGIGWNIKYYKGLGTSTAKEAIEYFTDINNKLINYQWVEQQVENIYSVYNKDSIDKQSCEDGCNESLLLAFDKKRADDRKKWLSNYDRNLINEPNNKAVSYIDFIHKEFIHFSNYDVLRSIPTMMDGLKPSQKKVLYGCFLKKLYKDEIKVAQLTGFISEKTSYHHGENSLNQTIIGMAQNFIGSNNINILYPSGQFGTRMLSGSDAASPRYIFTRLNDITPYIFREEDNPILNYLDDDGMKIEPEFYVPIIPMILVNGTKGIGTGYSTDIPNYNPLDIVENIYALLDNKSMKKMNPWYRGFKGKIIKKNETQYEAYGIYNIINDTTMEITELPIGTWTTTYKEFLEMLETGDTHGKKIKLPIKIQKFKDNNTDDTVHFTISFSEDQDELYELTQGKGINDAFKLIEKINITNMHLFDCNGRIRKYESPLQIIEEYANVRLEYYKKRKDYIIGELKKELDILKYKMMFIEYVIIKKIVIEKQKKDAIINKLQEYKFPRLSDNFSYDYLLNMSLYSLTYEKIEELKNKVNNKEEELENILSLTEKNIWKNELDEFVLHYKVFLKSFNEEKIIKKSNIKK
jgi:DNA topoisomerase-2